MNTALFVGPSTAFMGWPPPSFLHKILKQLPGLEAHTHTHKTHFALKPADVLAVVRRHLVEALTVCSHGSNVNLCWKLKDFSRDFCLANSNPSLSNLNSRLNFILLDCSRRLAASTTKGTEGSDKNTKCRMWHEIAHRHPCEKDSSALSTTLEMGLEALAASRGSSSSWQISCYCPSWW